MTIFTSEKTWEKEGNIHSIFNKRVSGDFFKNPHYKDYKFLSI